MIGKRKKSMGVKKPTYNAQKIVEKHTGGKSGPMSMMQVGTGLRRKRTMRSATKRRR